MFPADTMFDKILSAKDSVEDCYLHIRKIENPRELTKLLHPNRSFAKLLTTLPDGLTEKLVDMRWLESNLEDAGHTQLAQIVRWKIFFKIRQPWRQRALEWSQKAIAADIQGRWILQRKAFVQEEAQALHKFLALSSSEAEDKDAPLEASQLNT